MGTPISFNSGTTASYQAGIFKKATVGLNLSTGLVSGTNWWNGVDVTSSQYLIYSDIYSQGQSSFSSSRPTAWSTPDLSDASLIALVNTLPDRVGQPGFTTFSQAVNWLNQTGKYFLIKTGYENIVTSNLQLSLDAAWYNSYPGSGTSWYDLSPNTTTLTIVNGVGFSGVDGGTFVFDGTDDNIIIPDVPSLDISTAITVEVWVNYTAQGGTNAYSVITCKGYPWNWLLEDQNGMFNFRISTSNVSDSNISSGYGHGLNSWNHVVATYDGSTQKIYVNGVLKGSQALTGTINTSSSNMYIGCYTPSSYNVTGKIPIVRIYSTALTENQILQNFNAQAYRFGVNNNVVTSGLLVNLISNNSLSYPGDGTVWFDLSGNNNHFTFSAAPNFSNGFFNSQASVYAYRNAIPVDSSVRGYTLEAIFKINSSTGGSWQNVTQNGNSPDRHMMWYNGANNSFLALFHTPNSYNNISDSLSTGVWYHLQLSYNPAGGGSNGRRAWLNGVEKTVNNTAPGNATASGYFTISVDSDLASNKSDMSYYSVRYYDRSLSPSEIAQNFYLGNITTGNLLVFFDAANLVSYPTTGTVWYDLSGNGNNGTLQNGVGFSSTNGGVLTFDGSNDQVATNINRANLGNNMSVEAFFKYAGNTGDAYRPIIGGNEPGGGATEFFLGKNNGNNSFGIQDGNYDGGFVTNYDVFDGKWHHMCYTYDNGVGKLYLDGVLRNTGNFTKCNDSEQIYVGAEVQEGYWWKGDIGRVSYYTKTLTAIEVTNNFNAYKSRYGL